MFELFPQKIYYEKGKVIDKGMGYDTADNTFTPESQKGKEETSQKSTDN